MKMSNATDNEADQFSNDFVEKSFDGDKKHVLINSIVQSIQKYVKTYTLLLSLGVSVNTLVKTITQTAFVRSRVSLPYLQNRTISQFATFASCLISMKSPLTRLAIEFGDAHNTKQKIAVSLAINTFVSSCAVWFFPPGFVLSNASWFYFFFGVDYTYKLFENKHLAREKDEKIKCEVNHSIIDALTHKSWLLFAICSSFTWQYYIQQPTRAHGLPTKLFDFVGDKLSAGLYEKNVVTLLRGNSRHLSSTRVLAAVPRCYFSVLKVAAGLIAAKIVIQWKDKQTEQVSKRLKSSLYLIIKLATFMAGVPTLAILMTIIFKANKKTHLRIIGFVSGLLAYMYRGEERTSTSPDVPLTNRDAWVNMFRETVIASMTSQTFETTFAKFAFLAGLSAIFTIRDYEILTQRPTVLSDAKFLTFLSREAST